MKRDMELVRTIMSAIEESDNDPQVWTDLELAGYEPHVVSYQVKLLASSGLIEATDLSDDSGSDWRPNCLTWAGHEFLDAARNDTVWNKAMTKLKGQANTVPFEVLKAVVIQTCNEMFGVN